MRIPAEMAQAVIAELQHQRNALADEVALLRAQLALLSRKPAESSQETPDDRRAA